MRAVSGTSSRRTRARYLTLSTAAVANEVTAATDFGSAAISGLSSKERLYFRAIAKEANTLLTITPTTNFSTVGGGRSNNSVTAVLARGEYRINTSTGETSDPTFAVSGDTAGVFVALEETYLTVIKVAPGDLRMRGPQIFDAPGPSILVGVAVLTLTMTAPTVLQDLTRLPAQGTLTFTGPAPTAPTVSVQPAVAPDAGALALTGAQPLAVIGGNTTIAVDVARLKFKGPAGPSPVYTFSVTALTLTGYEPDDRVQIYLGPAGHARADAAALYVGRHPEESLSARACRPDPAGAVARARVRRHSPGCAGRHGPAAVTGHGDRPVDPRRGPARIHGPATGRADDRPPAARTRRSRLYGPRARRAHGV